MTTFTSEDREAAEKKCEKECDTVFWQSICNYLEKKYDESDKIPPELSLARYVLISKSHAANSSEKVSFMLCKLHVRNKNLCSMVKEYQDKLDKLREVNELLKSALTEDQLYELNRKTMMAWDDVFKDETFKHESNKLLNKGIDK